MLVLYLMLISWLMYVIFDMAMCSLSFFYHSIQILLIYCYVSHHVHASRFILIHVVTHLGTPRIAKFRGSSYSSVCNLAYNQGLRFKLRAHTEGELELKLWNSKALILSIIIISLSWLSSITKKGEFVSAFAPDVGFG